MIAYLSGTVKAKTSQALILLSSGVGYLLFMPEDKILKSQLGDKKDCFVYTIVREQEISLYAFDTLEERSLFELLISVSGLGPKSALEFFSVDEQSLKTAIISSDIEFLTQIKGVGKKTAERIVVELKNKIADSGVVPVVIKGDAGSQGDQNEEIILALSGLGFERMEIVKSLKDAPEFNSAEEAVLWFLKNR